MLRMDITHREERMMNRSVLPVMLAVTVLLATGCTAIRSHYPVTNIRESRDVTTQYRSLQLNPEYNYFYSGVESQPDAIMGIDKQYQVTGRFWHQVDLTPEQLEYWVKWGDREEASEGFSTRYLGSYMGAFILAPDGKTIGDWYSKKDWGIFEFPGENVVIPHPPRNRPGSEPRTRF